MKTGHPVFTEEFDQLRSRQRRLLASLPDEWIWLGRRILKTQQVGEDDPAGLFELVLRQQADKEFAKLPEEVPGRVEDVFVQNTIERFVSDRLEVIDLYESFKEEINLGRAAAPKLDKDKGEELIVIRLICFLAWADELAGGYKDSRLSKVTS